MVKIANFLLLSLFAASCATAPVVAPPERVVPPVPLDQRVSWLLRLEAQRVLRDPGVTAEAVVTPVVPRPARQADLVSLLFDLDPVVRGRAALAIGRVGIAEGGPALAAALLDAEPAVRGQAAFALGLIGRAEASEPLQRLLADADPTVRGRAAEGLGLIGAQLTDPAASAFRAPAAAAIAAAFAPCIPQMAALAPDDEAYTRTPELEACRLAIFALARLRDFDALARVALTADGRPATAWWPVAYALQRVGDPRAAPALEVLAHSAGVYTPVFALRGVAATPDGLALAQKLALDPAVDVRVRTAAIRALGRRGSAPAAAALLRLLATPKFPLMMTLEVLTALAATEDPSGFDAMIDRLADARPLVRAAAIAGAARIDPDRFLLVGSSLGADREWRVRAALATALGTLEPDRVRSGLIELTEDQDQRVRGPALTALARAGAPDLDARLVAALESPDYVVRATAARLIGERKTAASAAALAKAYDRSLSDAATDARVATLGALGAIGGEPALAVLTRALADRDWPVRLRAAELLQGLGDATAAPSRPAPLRHAPEFFESAALLHPTVTPVAMIETRLGTIEIALNVVEAPLTTLNFVALAQAGFFNGLQIHRLVPNFVVQTGDPRGDGAGGPGFSIPDELSSLPFLRGTVGMALSGRDTGGSQFFITHSPQPHLDGRYTVFGQVVKGMELVDQLSLHDVIDRVRIWDGKELR